MVSAIVFCLTFNLYLPAQYSLLHTGAPFQYQFDSLPQLFVKQLRTTVYPIPQYIYHDPTYLKNKVSSVAAMSKDGDTVFYRTYDNQGYLVEEIDHRVSHPYLPDNRGHHYYYYSKDHLIVVDSMILLNSSDPVKHQYIFDADLKIVSHYIFSNNHLLPDSTYYTYDSNGNCSRIISFYKNYIDDGLGAVQIIKNGDVVSMRSDTIEMSYEYRYNQMSTLMRKDNGRFNVYGTTEVSVGPVPGSRSRVDGEKQIFDSLSRIIEIQTRGLTVQFFYKKNVVSMDMIYGVNEFGEASEQRAITEYTFYYDKHGHLKKVYYFSNSTYPSGSGRSKVRSEKIRYRKNGLLLNNSYGGKMIYEYYN